MSQRFKEELARLFGLRVSLARLWSKWLELAWQQAARAAPLSLQVVLGHLQNSASCSLYVGYFGLSYSLGAQGSWTAYIKAEGCKSK